MNNTLCGLVPFKVYFLVRILSSITFWWHAKCTISDAIVHGEKRHLYLLNFRRTLTFTHGVGCYCSIIQATFLFRVCSKMTLTPLIHDRSIVPDADYAECFAQKTQCFRWHCRAVYIHVRCSRKQQITDRIERQLLAYIQIPSVLELFSFFGLAWINCPPKAHTDENISVIWIKCINAQSILHAAPRSINLHNTEKTWNIDEFVVLYCFKW